MRSGALVTKKDLDKEWDVKMCLLFYDGKLDNIDCNNTNDEGNCHIEAEGDDGWHQSRRSMKRSKHQRIKWQ